MVIRIALQCNEADAYLIMDDDNPAPRLLTRPGEGIYNDNAGALEGNSPFQVVWLPEEERDKQLAEVAELAEESGKHYPAADRVRGQRPGRCARKRRTRQRYSPARATRHPQVRAPGSGRRTRSRGRRRRVPPAERQQPALVGQRDEAALAMTVTAMVSIAAQYPRTAPSSSSSTGPHQAPPITNSCRPRLR